MSAGLGPEEKRRVVRLILLLAILVATVYALFDLAHRLEDAKPEPATDLNAAGTDG